MARSVDRDGRTALMAAVIGRDRSQANLLIGSGATVDLRGSYGNTPLWRAVFDSRGRDELIELLLKA